MQYAVLFNSIKWWIDDFSTIRTVLTVTSVRLVTTDPTESWRTTQTHVDVSGVFIYCTICRMLGNYLWLIDLYVWPLTFQPVIVTWTCLQGSVRKGRDDVCVARNTQASIVTGKQLIIKTSMFGYTEHVPRKQYCVPCFSKQRKWLL